MLPAAWLAGDANGIQRLSMNHFLESAVCHAPAVLRHAKAPDGSPLISGKSVTGFSNTEEDAVQLSSVVPFMLEDELKALGAHYSRADDWQPQHQAFPGIGAVPAIAQLVDHDVGLGLVVLDLGAGHVAEEDQANRKAFLLKRLDGGHDSGRTLDVSLGAAA